MLVFSAWHLSLLEENELCTIMAGRRSVPEGLEWVAWSLPPSERLKEDASAVASETVTASPEEDRPESPKGARNQESTRCHRKESMSSGARRTPLPQAATDCRRCSSAAGCPSSAGSAPASGAVDIRQQSSPNGRGAFWLGAGRPFGRGGVAAVGGGGAGTAACRGRPPEAQQPACPTVGLATLAPPRSQHRATLVESGPNVAEIAPKSVTIDQRSSNPGQM